MRRVLDAVARAWEALNQWVGSHAHKPWYPFALAAVVTLSLSGLFSLVGAGGCGFFLGILLVVAVLLANRRGTAIQARSVRRLERAAEAGDLEARHQLGLVYRDGAYDVPRERFLAVHHFRLAAEAGHLQAMVDLADLLRWGMGTGRPDPEEAARWIDLAREGGVPNLGKEGMPDRLAPTPAEASRLHSRELEQGLSRTEKLWHRWQIEWGPGFAKTLLGAAGGILLGLAVIVVYRNTGWLGRRDRERVVWGDGMNRVVAPHDPHATLPIPVEKRLAFTGVVFHFITPTGHQGRGTSVEAYLGRPVLLVLARGRYPAFRESLSEITTLQARSESKLLVAFIQEGASMNFSMAMMNEFHDGNVPLAVVGKDVFQPAAGDFSRTPVTLVLDRNGRVRQRWEGYQPGLMAQALASAEAEGSGADQ